MISVMIVEDEFLVRAGLKNCLNWEKEGFDIVAEASDGEEALRLYKRCSPAIVITDVTMPKMNGIEMMKEIRKQGNDTAFIALSASDALSFEKEIDACGVEACFMKSSFHAEEMLRVLRNLRIRYQMRSFEQLDNWKIHIQELSVYKSLMQRVYQVWKVIPKKVYLLYMRFEKADYNLIESMIQDLFVRNHALCIRLEADRGCWFLCGTDKEKDDLRSDRIEIMLKRYAAEEAVLVNSNELSEYLNMKEAIYHTLTLFEHRCRFGKKYGSAEEGQKMSVRQDVINLLWEFSECLKFRQYSRASELLLAAENKMIEYPAPSLLTEGIFHIINIISENDKKINAAAEYEKLKDSFDLDHIFRVLREYVGAMQDQEKDNSNYYIDRIKEYIGINYHEALTVQNLSDYVHLSPNYLGKMFYLHTGEYLKDYINTVRMENAGRLLLTRQYQVSEVAEMVGIADQRYFSRVFKKTFGCSPTEYIFRKEELNNSHGVE